MIISLGQIRQDGIEFIDNLPWVFCPEKESG